MTDDTPWDATTDPVNRVKVGGKTVEETEEELTANDVKTIAANEGVKKFHPENEDGDKLSAGDFPYTGTVVVNEYNENAS